MLCNVGWIPAKQGPAGAGYADTDRDDRRALIGIGRTLIGMAYGPLNVLFNQVEAVDLIDQFRYDSERSIKDITRSNNDSSSALLICKTIKANINLGGRTAIPLSQSSSCQRSNRLQSQVYEFQQRMSSMRMTDNLTRPLVRLGLMSSKHSSTPTSTSRSSPDPRSLEDSMQALI